MKNDAEAKRLRDGARTLAFLLRRDEQWAREGAATLLDEFVLQLEGFANTPDAPAPARSREQRKTRSAPKRKTASTKPRGPEEDDPCAGLTDVQRELIKTLSNTGPKKIEDVARACYGRKYHPRKHTSVARSLSVLRDKGLVNEDDGFWRLSDLGQDAAVGIL